MPRWRRLCVDVDDDGVVLGASIEHYTDRKADAEEILVMARSQWTGLTPVEVLEVLEAHPWAQGNLSFFPTSPRPSG